MTPQSKDEQLTEGVRVIYTRRGKPDLTEWPATYLRSQIVGHDHRVVHVIRLDAYPKQPRQVAPYSIRRA